MYLGFYGLREEPFGSTPDPRFLFASPMHSEAMASLQCCIDTGRGFFALIASPGMGKTTLLFKALEKYKDTASTAFLFNTQCDSREFIRFLLSEVGIEEPTDDVVRLHHRFNEFLVANSRLGRRFILVVDEAQNLSSEVLETIRLLSNFETSRAKLMQIVLAGQPELDATLKQPDLSQLLQRISFISRIRPFSVEETGEYIKHRLAFAGYRGEPIFSDEVIEIIALHSQGVPRLINSICFNALLLGYASERKQIDRELITEAVADLPYAHSGAVPIDRAIASPTPVVNARPVPVTAPKRVAPISAAPIVTAPRTGFESKTAQVKQPLIERPATAAPVLSTATAPANIPLIPGIAKPVLNPAVEIVTKNQAVPPAPRPAIAISNPAVSNPAIQKQPNQQQPSPQRTSRDRARTPNPLPFTSSVYGKSARGKSSLRNVTLVLLLLICCATAGYFVARYRAEMVTGALPEDSNAATHPIGSATESLPGTPDDLSQQPNVNGTGEPVHVLNSGSAVSATSQNETAVPIPTSEQPSGKGQTLASIAGSGVIAASKGRKADSVTNKKSQISGRSTPELDNDDSAIAPSTLINGIRPGDPFEARKSKFSHWDFK